jgi:FKBP-type peptidyl-prolyl cis-trans isomerase
MSTKIWKSVPVLMLLLSLALPCAGQDSAEKQDSKKDEPRKAAQRPKIELMPGGPRHRREFRDRGAKGKRWTVDVPPPEDVAAPPEDARRTESGLAYKVLQPGEPGESPGSNDRVTLRYTGWTTNGEAFDSTEVRAEPRSFPINQVIPGFSEAVQLLVPGEKGRFWIPAELAYAGEPNRPQGMLVFDIELISFEPAPQPPSDLAEPPADAIRTESGLAYKVIRDSDGERPGPEDMAIIDLNVWTPEGKLFDSSIMKGEPIHFRLDLTIPAFEELLPQMNKGAKWQIWSPMEMAILDDDSNVKTPMIFEVELVDFLVKPPTPPDVSVPPRDAEATISGLRYRVLQAGTGERKPKLGEKVEVNYAGWTRDGKMFDSSFDHGGPGTFALDEKKPRGWNEALTMMVVGDKWRIWIPEELAYAGQEDRPEGMLVFDVELLSIHAADEPQPEEQGE